MPTRISDLVKTVVADKKITREEWENQLKPQLKDVKKATPEMRELLDVWANDGFEDEAGVRAEMRAALTGAGYAVPSAAVPSPALVDGIVASNVTEADTDFAALLALAGKGTNKTTIAVLDGGFQLDHPAFVEKEWTNPDEVAANGVDDDANGLVDDVHGWDFADGDKDVSGEDHGSHVSGIATRGTDRIEEIACRVFDPLDPAKVAAAIDYACANGARVINMSFKVDEKKEVDLVKAAMERHPDVLFVKSAGNDGNQLVEGKAYSLWDPSKKYGVETYLPMSGVANMLVVASADAKGARADYSNHGLPYTTVAMRGSEVNSSVNGSAYRPMDGTSMAAPNVTAVVAKCLTLAPKLTPYDVRQILIDTTDKQDAWKELCASGGLVNQGRATRLAALVGLVRHEGVEVQTAADKLGLAGEERERLVKALESYPVAVPVRPTPPATPVEPPPSTPVVVAPVGPPPTTPVGPPPVVISPVGPPPTTPVGPPPVAVTPVGPPPSTPVVTPVGPPPSTPVVVAPVGPPPSTPVVVTPVGPPPSRPPVGPPPSTVTPAGPPPSAPVTPVGPPPGTTVFRIVDSPDPLARLLLSDARGERPVSEDVLKAIRTAPGLSGQALYNALPHLGPIMINDMLRLLVDGQRLRWDNGWRAV